MISLCVADDEPVIRQGLVSLPWESIGVRLVAEVGNGLDAVEVLQTEVIDVMLADIRMPGLDGIELSRFIAQEGLSTSVVLLSGYSDFEVAREAITYRVASYLLKPAGPDEILAAVRQAGEEVAKTKSTNLRLRLLEAELGRRQLVMDDAGIILGEVSHQGVADQVLRYIVDNQASHITLTSLSRDLSFSSIYLSRVVKKATGYTFLELLNGLRVQEAARLLRETPESFVRITERVGAVDSRHFGQLFKRAYGLAPSAYRKAPTTPLDARLAFTLRSLRADRDHE